MSPEVVSQLVSVLLPLGLPGVALVALALTIRGLWQDNKALRQQGFDFAIKSTAAMEANTAALNRISDTLIRGKQL